MITGSVINMLAIFAGAAAGLLLKWLAGRFSSVLPESAGQLGHRLQDIIMQGVALCVLYIGISGSLRAATHWSPFFPWSSVPLSAKRWTWIAA